MLPKATLQAAFFIPPPLPGKNRIIALISTHNMIPNPYMIVVPFVVRIGMVDKLVETREEALAEAATVVNTLM